MRLLDLCCGEGLISWGYWLSGRFSEVVGVDVEDMRTRYAFDFIHRDAMTLDYEFLMQFDFIHASPPCQAYSKITPDKSIHPRLIEPMHRMLYAAGKPYVIENVEGSGKELKPNLRLYGHDLGLPMKRVRYFYVSLLQQKMSSSGATHLKESAAAHINTGQIANVSIDHDINQLPGAHVSLHGEDYVSREEIIKAFGLWVIPEERLKRITREGMKQGVPPAFSKAIAEMVLPQKFMIG